MKTMLKGKIIKVLEEKEENKSKKEKIRFVAIDRMNELSETDSNGNVVQEQTILCCAYGTISKNIKSDLDAYDTKLIDLYGDLSYYTKEEIVPSSEVLMLKDVLDQFGYEVDPDDEDSELKLTLDCKVTTLKPLLVINDYDIVLSQTKKDKVDNLKKEVKNEKKNKKINISSITDNILSKY